MNVKQFLERYKDKLHHREDGCIIWKGSLNSGGYGRVNTTHTGKRTTSFLHIMAWEAAHPGESRHGMEVCHKCHVNNCCNPDHLVLCTHAENMRMNQTKTIKM